MTENMINFYFMIEKKRITKISNKQKNIIIIIKFILCEIILDWSFIYNQYTQRDSLLVDFVLLIISIHNYITSNQGSLLITNSHSRILSDKVFQITYTAKEEDSKINDVQSSVIIWCD